MRLSLLKQIYASSELIGTQEVFFHLHYSMEKWKLQCLFSFISKLFSRKNENISKSLLTMEKNDI